MAVLPLHTNKTKRDGMELKDALIPSSRAQVQAYYLLPSPSTRHNYFTQARGARASAASTGPTNDAFRLLHGIPVGITHLSY